MSMSLSKDFLARFLNPVFIETGTFDGRGTLMAHEIGFRTIHTIELDPARVTTARKNLEGIGSITVHEGDTVEILPKLLYTIDERATIFLDAHPVGEGDNCKIGKYRHPLLYELDLINLFSKRKDHTVIVDDRHDFGIYGTTDEQVMEKLKTLGPRYKVWIEGDVVIGEAIL